MKQEDESRRLGWRPEGSDSQRHCGEDLSRALKKVHMLEGKSTSRNLFLSRERVRMGAAKFNVTTGRRCSARGRWLGQVPAGAGVGPHVPAKAVP